MAPFTGSDLVRSAAEIRQETRRRRMGIPAAQRSTFHWHRRTGFGLLFLSFAGVATAREAAATGRTPSVRMKTSVRKIKTAVCCRGRR